jgi:NTE family protein
MAKTPSAKKPADVAVEHDQRVLVLQGGGALGAYQAGVYEELLSSAYEPDWIAGVSIGAINAALIAGNPPGKRIERMTEFWHMVSSGMGPLSHVFTTTQDGDTAAATAWPRGLFNQFSAMWSMVAGIPGFYHPRMPPSQLHPEGTHGAISVYDTAPLRATLERLIDFDLINSKKVRLSVGAVNVVTGNSEYFDNFERTIGPEHVMASGALPPAFPPVVIGGESYWDGGIVSNTPLQYVLDLRDKRKFLIIQVDLFSARGNVPSNLTQVQQRQKDILYSSRTRYNANVAAQVSAARKAIRSLLSKLPPHFHDDPNVQHLAEAAHVRPTDIVHLIYRQASHELDSKDYEFSRASVLDHWRAGKQDMRDSIEHPEWLKSSGVDEGITQYDLTRKT